MFPSTPLRFLRSRQLLVFFVCTVVGAGLASGIGWRVHSAPAGPSLKVSSGDLDLGEVWLQAQLKFRLPIRNVTSEAIEVEQLTASCNCTELTPASFTLPPHREIIVRGTIDLTRSVHDSARAQEPFQVTLRADVSAPRRETFQWPVRGIARRVLDLEPQAVELQGANEVVRGVFAPTVEIVITPRTALAEIKPEWSHDEAYIEFSGPREDGTYRLQYTPNHHLPRGAIETRVNLRTQLPDGRDGPEVEIPVRGFVVGPVRLSPPRLTLQPTRNAEAHPRTVATTSIVAADDAEWSIRGFSQVPEWLKLEVDGTERVLRASLANSRESNKDVNVVVHIESTDGELEEVVLHVTAMPLLPSVSKAEPL